MRRIVFGLALLLLLTLAACQSGGNPGTVPPAAGNAPPAANVPAQPQARAEAATATPAPTATPAATATATALPTPTRTPVPTPTPAPVLRRLTDGECCVGSSWTSDSKTVVYLDRPADDAPTAYYGLDVTQPNAKPQVFRDRIASYSGDFKYIVTRGDGFATVERVDDGATFRINTGRCGTTQPTGCNVSLSPDRTKVIWSVTAQATGPFEQRQTRIWLANLDGSDARVIGNWLSTRAGASWFPDSQRLLLSGRPSLDSQELALAVMNLADGSVKEIVRGERIQRGALSPDGQWLLYTVAFHDDPAQNGAWLIRTDGTDRRKLDWWGPSAWRAPGKLLYIPQAEAADNHTFYEYDVATGKSRPLTDPKLTPFKIGFGDWSMSPDGKKVVFVNAEDRNLWLLELPS